MIGELKIFILNGYKKFSQTTQPKCALNSHLICTKKVQTKDWI